MSVFLCVVLSSV